MSVRDNINSGKYKNNLPFPLSRTTNISIIRQAYREETERLNQQFKIDLFEEFGVQDNPKAELLFRKSWELGHNNGYSEVFWHFEDLVDLIL